MPSYTIPAHNLCVEQEIKRSRFVVSAGHTSNSIDVKKFIQHISQQHSEARHHCWAYVAGHPINSVERGCSDDGEPAGTAGKPMLNVLQHKKVGEITVVVSRYFGGIKLGAGGLVRAYSSSVQLLMSQLRLTEVILTVTAKITLPYELENRVRFILQQYQVDIDELSYDHMVNLTCAVPINMKHTIQHEIFDQTKGIVNINYGKEG
ncbi:MAG: YigZ family protein [Mariprofundaceae bacterium]